MPSPDAGGSTKFLNTTLVVISAATGLGVRPIYQMKYAALSFFDTFPTCLALPAFGLTSWNIEGNANKRRYDDDEDTDDVSWWHKSSGAVG